MLMLKELIYAEPDKPEACCVGIVAVPLPAREFSALSRLSSFSPAANSIAIRMPHKHTRKGEDKFTYASLASKSHILNCHSIDLPPTIIAKPLPVAKSAKS